MNADNTHPVANDLVDMATLFNLNNALLLSRVLSKDVLARLPFPFRQLSR